MVIIEPAADYVRYVVNMYRMCSYHRLLKMALIQGSKWDGMGHYGIPAFLSGPLPYRYAVGR